MWPEVARSESCSGSSFPSISILRFALRLLDPHSIYVKHLLRRTSLADQPSSHFRGVCYGMLRLLLLALLVFSGALLQLCGQTLSWSQPLFFPHLHLLLPAAVCLCTPAKHWTKVSQETFLSVANPSSHLTTNMTWFINGNRNATIPVCNYHQLPS